MSAERRLLDTDEPILVTGDEKNFDELSDRAVAGLLERLSEMAWFARCHVQVGFGAVVMRALPEWREVARFGSHAEALAWLETRARSFAAAPKG